MSDLQVFPGVSMQTKSGKIVEIKSVRIWVNKNRLVDCLIDFAVDGHTKFGDQKTLFHALENY